LVLNKLPTFELPLWEMSGRFIFFLAGRAYKLAFIRIKPAIFQGGSYFTLYPGAAIRNPSATTLPLTGSATEFNGFHALRIADIAKYKFLHTHKRNGSQLSSNIRDYPGIFLSLVYNFTRSSPIINNIFGQVWVNS
jgi:hypothetical protein